MVYEPFKCPDCSVWWRGETHKCEEKPKVTVTVKEPASAEQDKDGHWHVHPYEFRRYDRCYSCNKKLSKIELVAQYTRCESCRNKKGYRKYGYNKDFPSNWDA